MDLIVRGILIFIGLVVFWYILIPILSYFNTAERMIDGSFKRGMKNHPTKKDHS